MKKRTIIVLLALVTAINIIAAAFIYFDIQLLEAPETTISVDIIEINSEEAIIKTTIDVSNPNSFEIVTKDFELITSTTSGDKVAHMKIEGGNIPPNEERTFTDTFVIDFNGNEPGLLKSRLTGTVGVKTWFMQKTIPITINIITSIENVIKQIAAPMINIEADFGEFSEDKLSINGTVDVYNPNTFDISIENIALDIITDAGKNVGGLNVAGGTIPGKSSEKLIASGEILLESLNAKKLTINMSAIATARIADYNLSLPIYVEANIGIPDIEELLLSKDKPTILSIKLDEKLTFKGVVFNVLLEVNNTFKIDLIFSEIVCNVYLVEDDDHHLIGENADVEDIFAEVGAPGTTSCEILAPYSKLLTKFLASDWLMVEVSAKIIINGVNQSVFFEVRGYQDINIFR